MNSLDIMKATKKYIYIYIPVKYFVHLNKSKIQLIHALQ